MTDEEYAVLDAECRRRNFSLPQMVALVNIIPLLGIRIKHRRTHQEVDLTYCGKTRKQWANVKRKRFTEYIDRNKVKEVL